MHFSPKHVAQGARTSSRLALMGAVLMLALWSGAVGTFRLAEIAKAVEASADLVQIPDGIPEWATNALIRIRMRLAGWLVQVAEQWGFLPTMLGLALSSRLIVLPFAAKAERDRIMLRALGPKLTRLMDQLRGDPVRRARAIRQLYLRHGLTPLRNLVAVLGLPILMLAGIAVGDAAAIGGYAMAPLGRLSQPDPTSLLAVLAGGLIGLHAGWAHCRSWRHRLVMWFGLIPLLTLALALLPAATNIFVSLSVVLLLLQRALVVGIPGRIGSALARRSAARRYRDGIVPLSRAAAHGDAGAAAARLGSMIEAGFPVPRGVVLTPAFRAGWQAAESEEKARLLRRVARATGSNRFVVRGASPTGGDDDAACIAHGSVANVALDELAAAIDRMIASPESACVDPKNAGSETAAVIVQQAIVHQMGAPVQTGILSTRAPDAPGLMLIEMVDGEICHLLSGRVAPNSYRFGRKSGRPVGGPVGDPGGPFDLAPLVALGRGLEERFGAPQNILWAWDGHKLWLLDSRDIGAEVTPIAAPVLREWERVLNLVGAGAPLASTSEGLVRTAVCETLPRPTPATRSLIEAMHASGGSVDLACRALGLDYDVEEEAPPIFPTVFGRLYCNVAEARRRMPKLARRDRYRIRRRVAALDKRLRTDVLPSISARLEVSTQWDLDLLTTGRLVREIGSAVERFVTETHMEAELARIVADVILADARRALRSGGHDPAHWFPSEAPRSILWPRTLHDYSLAGPRMAEEAGLSGTGAVAKAHARPENRRETIDDRALSQRTAKLVALARSAQDLRRDVHRAAMYELAVLRKALLALDRRFDLRNGIFLLSLAEIACLSNADRERVRRLVAVRKVEREMVLSAGPLADALSLVSVEFASWRGGGRNAKPHAGSGQQQCFGVRVAGARRAGGRACVVDEAAAAAGQPLSQLMPGDVLVAPFIHPTWLSEVVRASGVILSCGGWLCPMAMVARERNIAMTVDVAGWADIPDGAHVTLELDGSIIVQAAPGRAGRSGRELAKAGTC